MRKKLSITFGFTVAIAIVALLAYSEAGANDCVESFVAGGFRVEYCGEDGGTYTYRISATEGCTNSSIWNFHQFLPVCKDTTPSDYFDSVGPSTLASGLWAIGEGYTRFGGWKVGDFTGQVLSMDDEGGFNCDSDPFEFTVTVTSAIKNVCSIDMALVVDGNVEEGRTQGPCCSSIVPVPFFSSFSDGITSVVQDPALGIRNVFDTATGQPYKKIKLLICEDENENGIKDPDEPCYPAKFGTIKGCIIDGNPRYYGYGGDGYTRP